MSFELKRVEIGDRVRVVSGADEGKRGEVCSKLGAIFWVMVDGKKKVFSSREIALMSRDESLAADADFGLGIGSLAQDGGRFQGEEKGEEEICTVCGGNKWQHYHLNGEVLWCGGSDQGEAALRREEERRLRSQEVQEAAPGTIKVGKAYTRQQLRDLGWVFYRERGIKTDEFRHDNFPPAILDQTDENPDLYRLRKFSGTKVGGVFGQKPGSSFTGRQPLPGDKVITNWKEEAEVIRAGPNYLLIRIKTGLKPGEERPVGSKGMVWKDDVSAWVEPRWHLGEGLKIGERRSREEALAKARILEGYLVDIGVPKEDIHFCGSIRREKPTVGDIDVVLNKPDINEDFYHELVDLIKAKTGEDVLVKRLGPSIASIGFGGFLFELQKTKDRNLLGASLLFATGSGEFNMGMRAWAKRMDYSLSQYGLRDQAGKVVAGKTEQEIFKALGVPYVEPKDRATFLRPQNVANRGVRTEVPPSDSATIPAELFNKLTDLQKAALASFGLPDKDSNGVPIPRDFLWNKEARHSYYKRRGTFKIPDSLKFDRV